MAVARTKYDAVAMTLHWVVAGLMIYMLFFGEDLIRHQSSPASPSLHASLGISILALTVVRLLWRIANPPPPLPAGMTALETWLSKAMHHAFYFLLILLPLTGWLAVPGEVGRHSYLADLTYFNWFSLPMAPSLGLPVGGLHALLSKVGIGLLALHVLAALKHQFINRDGLIGRMLPI